MQPPSMIDSHHTLHLIDTEQVELPCEHCRLGHPATHYAHTRETIPDRSHGLFLCDRCAALLCTAPVEQEPHHGR